MCLLAGGLHHHLERRRPIPEYAEIFAKQAPAWGKQQSMGVLTSSLCSSGVRHKGIRADSCEQEQELELFILKAGRDGVLVGPVII